MLHTFICIISTHFDTTLSCSGIGFGWNGGGRVKKNIFHIITLYVFRATV